MSIKTVNGTNVLVYIGNTAADVIFCSTTCTLNINAETTGASCKSGGSWAQSVEGNKSWDVSIDGLYQHDPDVTGVGFVDLAKMLTDDTIPNEVTLVIGEATIPVTPGTPAVGDFYWTGQAILTSASLTAPDGENSTWSCSFTGNGALTTEAYVAP